MADEELRPEIAEEIEVLESIFANDLHIISNEKLNLPVRPENVPDDEDAKRGYRICSTAYLSDTYIEYTPNYPDEIPLLSISPTTGELSEEELQSLLKSLQENATENLGMAMVFTLVSYLSEQLSALLKERDDVIEAEHSAAIQREIEAEAAKRRGTPVTPETFNQWKKKFDEEMERLQEKNEAERIANLQPKEKLELERMNAKLTGRQMFEQDQKMVTSDAAFGDTDDVSVDVSQYERRRHPSDEEDEEEDEDHDRLVLSESD